MEDSKANELIEELEALRRRVTELEAGPGDRSVEQALLDSERRYRVLYEENPSMYFTVDHEGTVLSVNPYGAEQLGYAVSELIGQPVLQVFHEADRQAVDEHLQTCVENPGTTFHWEYRKIRKTGELMWVREVARALRDRDGKTTLLIVCHEITQRRAMEHELRASRERYRSLYTKTPVMMHSLDRDRRLVDVTDHWLHVLGYPRHEVIGRKAMDFLTDKSRRYAESIPIADFYRRCEVVDLPFQVMKRDGEIIDVLLSAIVEYDDQGRFERSLEVLTDVTEQNRAEKELRRARDELEARVKDRTAELERQHRFLRQIIDTDPNFVFAKDREGRFTLVNQAVAEAYGTSVEELIGKRDADFSSSGEEVEYFLRMDREVMETLVEKFIPEEPFTDTEGRIRWLQTVKRPLVDDAGRCNLILGSATDITQRREAEERLRRSEAALRRSQRELQRLAGRLLTAQEDERRRLAREMHDDLTQRLAGIALQATRLQRLLTSPTDETSAVLEGVLSDLRRLSSDVHALSRRLHPSILDDLGLVDAIAAECEAVVQRDGIAVHFESSDVPSDLSTAASLCLYRVTQESLRNVAKHAGTTEARVFLTGEAGALTLTIEDRGTGFDSELGRSGEGLGLASMEERARLIGAEFSVRSVRGEGTTVCVRLVDDPSGGL